jgi:hypothetical protein
MALHRLTLRVMAGLDPAFHVLLSAQSEAWTPGTGPGVTMLGEV